MDTALLLWDTAIVTVNYSQGYGIYVLMEKIYFFLHTTVLFHLTIKYLFELHVLSV